MSLNQFGKGVFMNESVKKIATQLWSLVSDKDWDADVVKILGIALVAAGVVGWWKGKTDFQWIVGYGSTLVATGKFSKQG